jgi:hypothetical protein
MATACAVFAAEARISSIKGELVAGQFNEVFQAVAD